MKKITYKLIEEVFETREDAGFLYGLSVEKDGSEIKKYPDISSNKEELQKLIDLCNELKADPIHIEDILEDFIIR